MNRICQSVVTSLSTIVVGLPFLTPGPARADLRDLVKVTGTMSNSDSKQYAYAGGQVAGVPFVDGVEATCGELMRAMWTFLYANSRVFGPIVAGLDAITSDPEWEGRDLNDLQRCPEEIEGDFRIWYTTCSMTMFVGPVGSPIGAVRWTVPPEASEAEMIAASGMQMITVKLETALGQLSGGQTALNLVGEMDTMNISGPQGARTYTLAGQPQEAQRYEYDYVGRMSPLFGAAAGMDGEVAMDLIRVENKGWAYIAPEAEGLDVVRTFYDNFERHITGAAGAGSLLGGMVEQMARLVAYGFPLQGQNTSTTSMNIGAAGSAGGIIGAWAGYSQGVTSTSDYTITEVRASRGIGTDLCGPVVIPEGFEVLDLNEALAGTSGQAVAGGASTGPGAGAMGQGTPMASGAAGQADAAAAMADAMAQMNEAMAGMTPEQRQAMQQFGFGTGQVPAGANPGAVRAAGESPSASLANGDLSQTAQNYLQALGYEPGNTDGNVTMETTIAIAQFQAEKGLNVTGEVTPQLVGILSAEVDKRRGH